MAEARISVDQNEFLCPLCLDLLKDPVTTSCGHSYCKSCIKDYWDQMRVYSCPQCRQTFSPRPALAKNTMLAEVVEKLKKRKRSADCYAGAGDVQCDVCTGRKHKAVKSCLGCLNSYCQNHLDQHESFFRRKRQNLTDASGRLQEMICQKHDKILEVFCRTDQKFICVLCMDEHKNHDTVSAAAQRTEKQSGFQSLTKETVQKSRWEVEQMWKRGGMEGPDCGVEEGLKTEMEQAGQVARVEQAGRAARAARQEQTVQAARQTGLKTPTAEQMTTTAAQMGLETPTVEKTTTTAIQTGLRTPMIERRPPQQCRRA